MSNVQLTERIKYNNKDILPYRFKSNDKRIPLLFLKPLYEGVANPYFPGIAGYISTKSTLGYNLNIKEHSNVFRYKTSRRIYKNVIFSTGMYSLLGISDEVSLNPSAFLQNDNYRIKADIDILCLAVTSISTIPKIKYIHRNINFDIDMSKVTILVNVDKLQSRTYMSDNYT